MKLSEYIIHLNTLVNKNPEILNYDVVYSSDDEGNYFGMVHYPPHIGEYNHDDPFASVQFNPESDEPNAVCVN